MSMTGKKPATAEEFIKGARAEDRESSRFMRDKVFPVRLPSEMHDLLKKKARKYNLSLHEFILRTLEKEVT